MGVIDGALLSPVFCVVGNDDKYDSGLIDFLGKEDVGTGDTETRLGWYVFPVGNISGTMEGGFDFNKAGFGFLVPAIPFCDGDGDAALGSFVPGSIVGDGYESPGYSLPGLTVGLN